MYSGIHIKIAITCWNLNLKIPSDFNGILSIQRLRN